MKVLDGTKMHTARAALSSLCWKLVSQYAHLSKNNLPSFLPQSVSPLRYDGAEDTNHRGPTPDQPRLTLIACCVYTSLHNLRVGCAMVICSHLFAVL